MSVEAADRSYSPADVDEQVRAVGRYVLSYSLVVEALRWRVQVMQNALDEAPTAAQLPPRELLEAFSVLTRRYKDDLRIDALLASLEAELTAVFETRDAQDHGDWLVGYAWIDPDIGVEARRVPTLKHLNVAELNAASDRFEALERVFRMWMHAISPLTGDLGASPYFKIVDDKVRC
ncbi:hypothetical protein [Cryptosporangium aurantiacum]|uniref:Uncharacterized protein n=1 Tax=Cryptosporangium aurantiacum TaxID=134849 RepID=A0A1M7Q0R4_9ACTN|nr:hypothetical protein [Cryptosporangium aurantiacum]SHN23759.1 hypothetical protein SAMN05443668_10410 [Cryptosporangium aurantiacum]